MEHFDIGNLDGWRDGRGLSFEDFEIAAFAAVAKATGSTFVITRDENVKIIEMQRTNIRSTTGGSMTRLNLGMR